LAAVLLVIAACRTAPRAPRELPVTGAIAEHDVSAWPGWPRANPTRFLSKGHGFLWVDVHLAAEHLDDYQALNVTPPAGFTVVKVGYEKASGGEPLGLTVMAKMPPGYDPENGDWYYGVLGADGRRATSQGKLAPCLGCHRHADKRDHLFGVGTDD
jgi:hypothetical protein